MKRLLLFRREVFWIPLLFAILAVAVQAYRITSKPVVYNTLGRVAVEERVVQADSSGDGLAGTIRLPADFMSTQIEMLESDELKQRTVKRVRSLYPEWKDRDVDVWVTQTKGSFILNVSATGKDAKYLRVYLDALLEEYISTHQMRNSPADQIAIMQRPGVATAIVPDFWIPLMVWAFFGSWVGNLLMRSFAIQRNTAMPHW